MSDPLRVLVVDDEPRIRQTLSYLLEGDGHAVEAASSGPAALAAARQGPLDLALLDVRLGTDDGLDLIGPLLEALPRLRIVVVTANATVPSAVEAMRRGAVDYLPKPFTPEQVRLAIRKAVERRSLEDRVATLQDAAAERPDADLGSQSPAMRSVLDTLRRVAPTDATVLLRGESGTGKGVLARAVHGWSGRAGRPFVTVHAPSLSAELLESELFGHVKGAFTGAVDTREGRVAQAEGGTLFVDEVGDLPLALQPKVLRFLQDREYERVGDAKTRRADVRLVAATNRDLGAMVAEGAFREDLLYRLRVIEVEVPPLRQRAEDVLPLAEAFLAHFGARYGRAFAGFTEAAERAVGGHDWPGNVRELQNAVERASILSPGPLVDAEHLPLAGPAPGGAVGGVAVGSDVTLAELEEAHIRRVVDRSETLEAAARTLGIDPVTLWRRRKQYGI